jgi:predicted nucleic acid-binding protein
MNEAFIDTNIALDLLTGRMPHYTPASILFSKADLKEIKLYISSLSFSNIHYILSQENSEIQTRKALTRLKVLVNVLSVDDKIIELALASNFKDLEDAIQYFTATSNGLKVILTRNLKDFSPAKIPVMTAESFLKTLD